MTLHRSGGGRGGFLLLPLLLATLPAAAAEPEVKASFLPSWFSGDFGTGVDARIVTLPFSVSASFGKHELRATLPWLSVTTAEPVVLVGGEVVGRPDEVPAPQVPPLPGGPAGSEQEGETSVSGIGDLVVQYEHFFLEGDGRRPWLSGIARLKVPTADEEKGLGTGSADYGGGIGLSQPLGGRWSGFGSALYLVRGDAPGLDLRDTFWWSAGVQARLGERASIHVVYDDRQSSIRGREASRSAGLGFDRRIGDRATFRAALFAGLSETAEDLGASIGFSFGS
ncbi:MAG TPA: hypothetical protein VJV23_13220 [Candidatus Polarisedimenticolia bacterium]|nr:hypothetical protein [Candidatus Polarisedimenticolia bacterium]